jgi:hypothetical protein
MLSYSYKITYCTLYNVHAQSDYANYAADFSDIRSEHFMTDEPRSFEIFYKPEIYWQ